jgi:hypothetical protein
MLLTREQIMMLYLALDKYPTANSVVVKYERNGSGLGPNETAIFQDRGNLFKQIAPKELGREDITDVSTW